MRKGFTLIELVVVVAITVYLSTLFIFYNSSNRQSIAVSVDTAKIAQLLLRAKSLAVASYAKTANVCGYGVRIDRTTGAYTMSPYSLSDCKTPVSASSTKGVIDKANVKFISCSGAADDVIFFPPDPTVAIWSGGATTTEGSICLQSLNGKNNATITVNSVGQVSF